jgi:hypothetical protein
MSQFTWAAATGAVAVALADAEPDADAVTHGAVEAAALALGPALAPTLAEGEAQSPSADWSIVLTGPPETARTIPRVRPNAIGIARGTAMRAARLLVLRRRHADRCPLSI